MPPLTPLPEYDEIDALMREFIRHMKMYMGIAQEGANHIDFSTDAVGTPIAQPKLYQPVAPVRPDAFADAAAYETYRTSFNQWLANKKAFDNSAADYTKRVNDYIALTNSHAHKLVNRLNDLNLIGVSFTATEDGFVIAASSTAVDGGNPNFWQLFPYPSSASTPVYKLALTPIV